MNYEPRFLTRPLNRERETRGRSTRRPFFRVQPAATSMHKGVITINQITDIETAYLETMNRTTEALNRNNEIMSNLYNALSPMLYYMASTGTYNLPMPNLDNCTDESQSTPKEETSMAYKRVLLPVGIDNHGNPINKQISGKSEADRFMSGLQAAISSGRIKELLPPEYLQLATQLNSEEAAKDLHPFTAYAHTFYARYKGHLRATTNVTQKGWLKQQCAFFGDEPIEKITVSRIQDYVNSIQENTTATISKKLIFLREIFSSAYEDELISRNPTDSKRINLGGKEGKGIRALPRDTVKALIGKISICEDLHIKLFLAFMLYAGVRREEILGLRWEDINFDTGFFHIERAVTYPSSKPIIGLPKTKSSDRDVAMPDELIRILKPHRQIAGFLISDAGGKLLSDYNVKKLRNASREYSGLQKLDARELRHSYASMLHAAGIERKLIGTSMGHTNFDTTDGYIDVEQARMNDVRNAGIGYVLAH